jgi:hypothetical protein
MKYKTKTIATLRTKTGSDAGKIPAGEEFDSNTDMTIREALHRKIESGNYYGKYAPASACDAIQAPPVDPPVEPDPPTDDSFPPYIPIGAELMMRFKVNGVYTEYFYFTRTA